MTAVLPSSLWKRIQIGVIKMEPIVLKWPFATITVSEDSYRLESPVPGIGFAVSWATLPLVFTQTNGS
tara:strand:+ start:1774 stop:1977 length:204 start_codon:yes stop_codon:yes gene_type:complete